MSGDAAKADVPVLWQLRRSIFAEKAVWALDYKGLSYRVRTVHPGLHPFGLWLRRRGTTVPVLDVGGRSIRGSAAVIAAVDELAPDPPLYPADESGRREVAEVERFFDEHCGHEVRRISLDHVLRDPDLMLGSFLVDRPRAELRMARAAYPMVERATRRRYGIQPGRVQAAHVKLRAALDRVESLLGPEGYLVGDGFTAADLAGAALLAPIFWPPEYPDAPWGEGIPGALTELRESFSDREAFGWVLEMYRRHRGASAKVRSADGAAAPVARAVGT